MLLTAVLFFLLWGLSADCHQIESCIDEWSSGAQTNKMFTVDKYQDVLDKHLNNLADFDEHTKAQGLLPKLLSHLHDNGQYVFVLGLINSSYLCSSAFTQRLTHLVTKLAAQWLVVHLRL